MESPRFNLADLPVPMVFATFRIIRDCNEAFAELFERRPQEIVGRSFSQLYPSNADFVRVGEAWRLALAKSDIFYDEGVMATVGGRHFWCAVHGRTLTPADPFAEVLYCFQAIARPARFKQGQLTVRQLQIMTLVAQGRRNADIAAELNLSQRTVESHRARLMRQAGVRNAAELTAWFSTRQPG